MQKVTIRDSELCVSGMLERPRYFPRQMITPGDMTLEADYFRDRLRRHNRLLHGWGVVCGAMVCPVAGSDGTGTQPWKVKVQPGYILGPYGDEIVIASEWTIDLRTDGVTVTASDPSGELVDPWCSEVMVERKPGKVWVAIKYKEIMARPVRVQPAGCGCDEAQCEYSRWCDGYEVGFLNACPSSHQQPPPEPGKGPLIGCPPCPSDPWVVLAEVELGDNGKINTIDNCSCRRMVWSFAEFWWRCQGGAIQIKAVTVVTPAGPLNPGQQNVTLDIAGVNIDPQAKIDLESGVSIKNTEVSNHGTHISIAVDIMQNAVPGDRTLTIMNPDCATATWAKALTIVPSAAPAPTP